VGQGHGLQERGVAADVGEKEQTARGRPGRSPRSDTSELTPLESLTASLPKMSGTELTEAALVILEEGAERANNYAGLYADGETPPIDVVNEGSPRARAAHRDLSLAEKDLRINDPAILSGC
jgi:hypothetical protein